MDWLFIAGVSMDLAGAIVIVAAVLSQTRPESNRGAGGVFGTNLMGCSSS